jgi:KamA family protein
MMTRAITGRDARPVSAPPFQVYTNRQLGQIPELQCLTAAQRFDIEVVASILPFRVNRYVLDELVDWSDPLNDPMFILTFPQKDMLAPDSFEQMAGLMRSGAPQSEIAALARKIRIGLNPHPAGQMQLNIPELEDQKLGGMQHKYSETLLFFPSQGQVCHSYCTFCFRWAQFVGDRALRFASSEAETLYRYLALHREVTDLLLTGGDPMVMKTKHLCRYLEPLLYTRDVDHVQTVRIGTKALTYWPHRFVTDPDADELLRLLERLIANGRHVAIMAHYNHWRELEPQMTQRAIRRIRDTGAEIRCQGPLLAHINDDASVWARLWREQVRQGLVPYYMFVERDTGARRYFEVPLARAWEIYREAIGSVSGLARTVRGPSMSACPGKVEIQGLADVNGERVFVLRFLQGRMVEWVQRPFFAKFDEAATWLDDLRPAFGETEFFFEPDFRRLQAEKDQAA